MQTVSRAETSDTRHPETMTKIYTILYLYFFKRPWHHGNQHVKQHNHGSYIVSTKDPVAHILREVVIERPQLHSRGFPQWK